MSPLAQRQILAERAVEGAIRNQQVVIHARTTRAVLQLRDVRLNLDSIFFMAVFRRDFQALLSLHIDQQNRLVQLRPEFLWIENVEEDDFVSMVTQRFDGGTMSSGDAKKSETITTMPRLRRKFWKWSRGLV